MKEKYLKPTMNVYEIKLEGGVLQTASNININPGESGPAV
mgnify:CR=1 FL=1